MTTYNTGNPVPSGDARDRFDNSQAFDEGMNSASLTFIGRLGQTLQSWAGAVGYQVLGDYVDGTVGQFTITNYNQVFRRGGEYWRASASTGLPYTTTGNWGTEGSKFVSVGDAVLRSALAADTGATLLGYKAPWTGAQGITQAAKNAQTVHIDEFPASPADTLFSRAIDGTPTGFALELGAGTYIAKFAKVRSNITIRGKGMPYYNTAKTALTGGGTIVQGTFGLTGSNIHIENLGVDCGLSVCDAINGGAAMDALVLNDAARQPLNNCVVRDVIALCKDAPSAAHNFLLEGCVDSRFENLHARYGQWGVVMKTSNSTADGLYSYACSQAGYTFKSDTGVAGAVALRSSVTNVHVFEDDYSASVTGILVYAATSSIADFNISNFQVHGCDAGLKLLCDSRADNVNLLLGANINNGVIRNSRTFGFEAFGAMSSVLVSNLAITGTVSNKAIKVWSDCLGIEFTNVLASSPGVNALNVDLAGRFTINNVRSCVNSDYGTPSGINLVPESAATFKVGTYLGTIGINGVQTWTPSFTGLNVVNGTGGVTISGSFVIIGKMIKGRVSIATTGTATTASTGSTTFINNLPFTALQNDTLQAVSGTVTQGGIGLVAQSSTNGYTPTWSAYNGTFTVSFQYLFQV